MRCATGRTRAISRSTTRSRWIERLKPRRAILTNLHADLDYEVLRGKLPVHVVPAFDGMTFARCGKPVNPGHIKMFHNMSYANLRIIEPTCKL